MRHHGATADLMNRSCVIHGCWQNTPCLLCVLMDSLAQGRQILDYQKSNIAQLRVAVDHLKTRHITRRKSMGSHCQGPSISTASLTD